MTWSPELLKRIGIGLAAAVAGFLLGTFLLTMPTPNVLEAKDVEGSALITGTTRPGATVLAFDGDGRFLLATVAGADGTFLLEDVPRDTGGTLFLRAMKGRWLASPPVSVKVAWQTVEGDATDTASDGVEGEELPPGIPPTSTAPETDEEATSTAASTSTANLPEVIIATASLSNMEPKAGTSVKILVDVRDEDDRPVTGAIVTALVHDSTDDYAVTLKGGDRGTYTATIKVPADVQPGTTGIVDITAKLGDLASTARALFTMR